MIVVLYDEHMITSALPAFPVALVGTTQAAHGIHLTLYQEISTQDYSLITVAKRLSCSTASTTLVVKFMRFRVLFSNCGCNTLFDECAYENWQPTIGVNSIHAICRTQFRGILLSRPGN